METSIGEMIKTFRVLKKMTQEELANHLNVSKGTVSRYETGKRIPNINTIKEISKVLQVPTFFLTDNKNEAITFEEMKKSVDKTFPTLAPILELLNNSAIQEIYQYNFNDLAMQHFDNMFVVNIENAIFNTLRTIDEIKKREEETGEVYSPLNKCWFTKEEYKKIFGHEKTKYKDTFMYPIPSIDKD